MSSLNSSNEHKQFAASLHMLREEMDQTFEHASVQLDHYSSGGGESSLRQFLDEILQLRGMFKMLEFRAGERLCSELAETVRFHLGSSLNAKLLDSCVEAVMYLRRYTEFVLAGQPVAPSLLIPTINHVRRQRQEKPLPEAYFFMNLVRPRQTIPASTGDSVPYRRVRQMLQLGLIGLIRSAGRHGPLQVIARASSRVELCSRGSAAWPFWNIAAIAVDTMTRQKFAITPLRITLLSGLERQIRMLSNNKESGFQTKIPEWLFKEFLYMIALAKPDTQQLIDLQEAYQLKNHVSDADLDRARDNLKGPDQSALVSFSRAVQEEIHVLKEMIDHGQRNDTFEVSSEELIERLSRIADTLNMVDMHRSSELTEGQIYLIQRNEINFNTLADVIVQLEQDVLGLIQTGKSDHSAIVDPITLREAEICVISEAISALVMVKRAVGSYLESKDKMHVNHITKSLHDVSGALIFLGQPNLQMQLVDLETFADENIVRSMNPPASHKIEAFADAITAIEYYLDTIDSPASVANEALRIAEESLVVLRPSNLKGTHVTE
ncbi:MAG: hypothetical protein P1U57_03295 [Oleibacter sp.]|nr:hypothetical protein [Thalassolituus sp.]